MRRASRLRNPSLARIFREAGIMEQWGTGVQRVYDQIAAAGLPEPHVEEVMDRLRFTIYVPSHAPDAGLGADAKHQDRALSEQVSKVSEQAMALLTLASNGPLSRAELLAGINLSDAYAELDALDLRGVTTVRVENNEYAVKNRVRYCQDLRLRRKRGSSY